MAPSGSGKTTLLAIMGGLLSSTSGEVYVTDAGGTQSSVRHHTGWVFQTTNLLGRRSIIDNVIVGALARGTPYQLALEQGMSALDLVGLGDMDDRAARTLSGGEAQRLSIARALVAGADFLLADEPTGQLDKATTDHVVNVMLAAVERRSVGAVVVTHDRSVAERCTRIVALTDGRLIP